MKIKIQYEKKMKEDEITKKNPILKIILNIKKYSNQNNED